ncbi:MAG: thioredoxin [Clostridia bacterium]|nr:thioredoxin [Clostridia bacterium]
MAVLHLTKENFDTEIQSASVPVLVDFWASWCGPCRMVAPAIEQLAEEFDTKAKITKVNVDEEGELALRFDVRSIPTVFVFKNGEIVEKAVGAYPKDHYAGLLTKHL